MYILRTLVRGLGLKRFSLAILKKTAKIKQYAVVRRLGSLYALDLKEVIDFSLWVGMWERHTIHFIQSNIQRGDYVIEVGANIGAHTLFIARRVGEKGKVFAFEPTTYARNKLLNNLRLNSELLSQVEVFDNIVTDNENNVPTRKLCSSWMLEESTQIDKEVVQSEAISIDQFAIRNSLEKLNLLKIDVDGYDYKVLRGASAVITRHRPLIYIELCEYALRAQGDSVKKIYKLLTSLGYSCIAEDGRVIDSPDDVIRIIGYQSSINAIFMPPQSNLPCPNR